MLFKFLLVLLVLTLFGCKTESKDEDVVNDKETLSLTGNWTPVGSDQNGVINYNASADAGSPSLAQLNNNLYATWYEASTSNVRQIRAKQWDGTSWLSIDGGIDGLNWNTSKDAQSPRLTSLNTNLYVIWSEADNNTGYSQVRVKEWDGTNWRFIDGSTDIGLNKDSSQSANEPHIATHDSKLYATWSESYTGVNHIRVKQWNGDATWDFIDSTEGYGVNYDLTQHGYSPQLISFNSKLYAIWREANAGPAKIRIKEWDGTTWVSVDASADAGLNFNRNANAYKPHLSVHNNRLYATWTEDEGTANFVRVREWDGTNWSFIDGGGTGINGDTSLYVTSPRIGVFDSKLYYTWVELDINNAFQVRIKEWNGSSWRFVDGDPTPDIVVDPITSKNPTNPMLMEYQSELYCIWEEGDTGSRGIRVKKAEMQ